MENTRPNPNRVRQANPLHPERVAVVYNSPLPRPIQPIPESRDTLYGQIADIRPFAPEMITAEKKKNIQRLLKVRKIQYLTHFTRVDNIKSILQRGILSRAQLSSDPSQNVRFNQPGLPDAWQGAVSCNISFPDYRLFYNLQERTGHEWAVILIDAQILTSQAFYFFQQNARESILSPDFTTSELPFLQRYESLAALFSDYNDIQRVKLEIPDHYTTNPQAEILSFLPIPCKAILQIHFYNDYKFNQWFITNRDFVMSQDKKLWASGLQYFSPRSDYTHWRSHRSASQ